MCVCVCVCVILHLSRFSLKVAQKSYVLQPATRIPLKPNHTETPTHMEPRTIRPMW